MGCVAVFMASTLKKKYVDNHTARSLVHSNNAPAASGALRGRTGPQSSRSVCIPANASTGKHTATTGAARSIAQMSVEPASSAEVQLHSPMRWLDAVDGSAHRKSWREFNARERKTLAEPVAAVERSWCSRSKACQTPSPRVLDFDCKYSLLSHHEKQPACTPAQDMLLSPKWLQQQRLAPLLKELGMNGMHRPNKVEHIINFLHDAYTSASTRYLHVSTCARICPFVRKRGQCTSFCSMRAPAIDSLRKTVDVGVVLVNVMWCVPTAGTSSHLLYEKCP